jgi:hypothetical protein
MPNGGGAMTTRVLDELIGLALERAKLAFWDAIAEEFPEATDTHPDMIGVLELDEAMRRVVKCWLVKNAPGLFDDAEQSARGSDQERE